MTNLLGGDLRSLLGPILLKRVQVMSVLKCIIDCD